MSAGSVAYHRANAQDGRYDNPGKTLEYYGSRGETPLEWGGNGATHIGLAGRVEQADYDALFRPNPRDPVTGKTMAATRIRGVEFVVRAPKSVSCLGVLGAADDMHAILDAQVAGEMGYLERVMEEKGGRRGREQVRCATSGLTYARTRHATSRAQDPDLHEHVLVANMTAYFDAKGGTKAVDTAMLLAYAKPAHVHGLIASAAKAMELGYRVELDRDRGGNLSLWRLVDVDRRLEGQFSKRSRQIDERALSHGYEARSVAARDTRVAKRYASVDTELMPVWRGEMAALGLDEDRERANLKPRFDRPPPHLTAAERAAIVAELLGDESALTMRKRFCRRHVETVAGPYVFCRDAGELDKLVDQVMASPEMVPLLELHGATSERAYATATALGRELAITEIAGRMATRRSGPRATRDQAITAIAAKEAEAGFRLSESQYRCARDVLGSPRDLDMVEGKPGAGKTTMLDAIRAGEEMAGRRVWGVATSGTAARKLGDEAHIDSMTGASFLGKLECRSIRLDDRSTVFFDESENTDDKVKLAVMAHCDAARARLIPVGDKHQISSVAPGGAFEAMQLRFPQALHLLTENLRQYNPDEVAALDELRDGDIDKAVQWYSDSGRFKPFPTADEVMGHLVGDWAADVAASGDITTPMQAYQRVNVDELNVRARSAMIAAGRVDVAKEIELPDGGRFAPGDRVVMLKPNHRAHLTTSERAQVVWTCQLRLGAPRLTLKLDRVDDNGNNVEVTLAGDDLAADRLTWGWAVTTHRELGDTFEEPARSLEDGGGRELTLVAMSRSRTANIRYGVAENLEQMVEQCGHAWSQDARESWVLGNTPTLTPEQAVAADLAKKAGPVSAAVLRHQVDEEWKAVNAVMPEDAARQLAASQKAVSDVEADRRLLDRMAAGDTHSVPREHPYRQGPAFEAAEAVTAARAAERQARMAADTAGGPLQRRRRQSDLEAARADVAAVTARLEGHLQQERVRLDRRAERVTVDRDRHAAAVDERRQWLVEHPVAARRLDRLAGDLERVGKVGEWQRHAQDLDGQADQIERQRPAYSKAVADRAAEDAARARLTELQEQLAARRSGRLRGPERADAEAELLRLRLAHPGAQQPAGKRAALWDGLEARAAGEDGRQIDRLRHDSAVAGRCADDVWRGLHDTSPPLGRKRNVDRTAGSATHAKVVGLTDPNLYPQPQRGIEREGPELSL
jgi:conjugative relaxase-like TrwC/TraI family protein